MLEFYDPCHLYRVPTDFFSPFNKVHLLLVESFLEKES